MIDFKKQKEEWNQVVRERKYRPSFFGFPVHADWNFLLSLFVVGLVLIAIFTFNTYLNVEELSKADFTGRVETTQINKINIDKFDKILKRIEKN